MTAYTIRVTQQAKKDIDSFSPTIRHKLKEVLLDIIAVNPYEGRPLVGSLQGNFSYQLTYRDRIILSVDESRQIVYLKRVRSD